MKMYSLLIALLLCFNCGIAQTTPESYHVELVNKDKLQALQSGGTTCILLKFWIPNCKTAEQQFKEFADFEKSVGFKVVYLGITNDPKKITDIARKYDYKGTLYMLDTAICTDIYKRYDIFCEEVSEIYKAGKGNFDTMIIDAHGKLVWKKDVPGFPAWLKKEC